VESSWLCSKSVSLLLLQATSISFGVNLSGICSFSKMVMRAENLMVANQISFPSSSPINLESSKSHFVNFAVAREKTLKSFLPRGSVCSKKGKR